MTNSEAFVGYYFSIENSVTTTDGLRNARSIHPYVVIVPRGVAGHSVEMREAACSPQADEGLMLAVKALGMTVADLLAQPELVRQARDQFEQGLTT